MTIELYIPPPYLYTITLFCGFVLGYLTKLIFDVIIRGRKLR